MTGYRTILSDMTGACDCHIHFYGHQHEYMRVPGAVYQPPQANPQSYRAVMERLSLQRVVVVQSVIYGTDNRCMLEGLANLGCEARGVAVVPLDITDQRLNELHRKGICGVRAFMLDGGVYSWDELQELAARVRNFGWHLQVQMNGRELETRAADLLHLNCLLVIDHIGKFIPPVGLDHPSYKALRRLIDSGKCWVKLSAPYESSLTGAPDYRDISFLARNLVDTAPQRMLWASNWPHTAQIEMPNDSVLLELLSSWAPSEHTRSTILCTNPDKLYGF